MSFGQLLSPSTKCFDGVERGLSDIDLFELVVGGEERP
jgi:hypothetical protein